MIDGFDYKWPPEFRELERLFMPAPEPEVGLKTLAAYGAQAIQTDTDGDIFTVTSSQEKLDGKLKDELGQLGWFQDYVFPEIWWYSNE